MTEMKKKTSHKKKKQGKVVRIKKRIKRGKETISLVINVRVEPSNVTVDNKPIIKDTDTNTDRNTNTNRNTNAIGNGGAGGGGGIGGGGGGGGGVTRGF